MEASEERAGDKADHASKPSGQSASSPGTETRRASSRRASPSRAALTVATDRGKSPPAQDSSTSNGDDSTSPAAHADSASTYGHIAAELYDQLSSAWWAAYEREPSTTMFMTGAAAVFALLLSRMGVLLPLMALALGVVGGYVWAAPEVAPETPSMVGLGKPRALSISIQRLASQFARGRQRRGSKGRSWWRQPVDGGGTGQEQTSSAGGSVAVSPVLQPAGMTYEQAPSVYRRLRCGMTFIPNCHSNDRYYTHLAILKDPDHLTASRCSAQSAAGTVHSRFCHLLVSSAFDACAGQLVRYRPFRGVST